MDLNSFSKVQDLIGKDFEYGARGPEKYDCYNLCREVYKRFGIELPDFDHPSDYSLIHQLVMEGKELFEKIEKPEPLCLVTFCLIPPFVSHIGVVIEPPYFLHIMEKKKSVIERLDSFLWKKRIKGYFKWKEK